MVVEKVRGALRLAAVDQRGWRRGLAQGMTLADARARVPLLAVANADPGADERFMEKLATLCECYTPLVALDPPHGLTLDITGCAHLFGGETALRLHVCTRIRQLGLFVRTAIACTPQAARALARFGPLDPPSREAVEAELQKLPVSALEAARETTIALSRAGLKTLGDLAERAPAALVARFGADLTMQLQRVLGREDTRITPLRPPPECMAEQHFPEPLLHLEAVEIVLKKLVTEAASVLEGRGAGGRAFEASFFRSDGAVRRILVETGRPSRDVAAILRLFRERLDRLADPLDPGFGFDAIRLGIPICEPLGAVQPELDGRALEQDVLNDLVDRLATRFGRDRVLRFVAQDSHHPARAALSMPANAMMTLSMPVPRPVPWPVPEPAEPPIRPLQLFNPPQLIEALAEVPDGPPLRFRWRRVLHDIARAEGPERIAPEWWVDGLDEPTRDYYRIEDVEGRRFWVFRSGLYERETGKPRWFLHGLFA